MHKVLELHMKNLMAFDNSEDYVCYWNRNVRDEVNKLNDNGTITDDEVEEFVKSFGMNGDEFEELLKLKKQKPLWFKTIS